MLEDIILQSLYCFLYLILVGMIKDTSWQMLITLGLYEMDENK